MFQQGLLCRDPAERLGSSRNDGIVFYYKYMQFLKVCCGGLTLCLSMVDRGSAGKQVLQVAPESVKADY